MRRIVLLSCQLLRLVCCDLGRDGLLVLCQVLALAAVLTPLMVLHGLRHGILDRLQHEMETSPAMREITPVYHAARRYDETWLAAARARADVGFVTGNILFAASELPILSTSHPGQPVRALIATTAPGDPLADDPVRGWPVSSDRVVLSVRAARELAVATGDTVTITVPRFREQRDETQRFTATVVGIVAPDRLAETKSLIFLPEALAFQIDRYRNGYAVAERGWSGTPPPNEPMLFARFRLYARTLADVAAVAAWLRDQGIVVDSRLPDIGPLLDLNAALGSILNVISVFSVLGFLIALAALQWSETARKAREIALLAVVGYGPGFLMAMRLAAGAMVVALGVAVGTCAFLMAAAIINGSFPPGVGAMAGAVCSLPAQAFQQIALAALLIGLSSGSIAALRVLRLDPALVVREI